MAVCKLNMSGGDVIKYERLVEDGAYYNTTYQLGISFILIINPTGIFLKDKTYIGYLDRNWDCKIMVYNHLTKDIEGPVLVGDCPPGADNHGSPAICMDNDEYIHIFYGCHNSPLLYRKSILPRDITEWSDERQLNWDATYPNVYLRNGILFLFLRAGGGYYKYSKSANRGETWLQPPITLVSPDYHITYNPTEWGYYCDGLTRMSPDGVFHVAMSIKRSVRSHVFYLKSDDGGVTWKKGDGTLIGGDGIPPFWSGEIEKIFDSGWDIYTLPLAIGFDENNCPYILFHTLLDKTFKVAKWTGTAWQIITIASCGQYGDGNFIQDYGVLDVISSKILEAYLVRTEPDDKKGGGNLEKWRSEDGGETWNKIQDIWVKGIDGGTVHRLKIIDNYRGDMKIVFEVGDGTPTTMYAYGFYGIINSELSMLERGMKMAIHEIKQKLESLERKMKIEVMAE